MNAVIEAIRQRDDLPRRYNALYQLTQSPLEPSLPALLIDLMRHDNDWGSRQNAAWVAGRLRLLACWDALLERITAPGEDEQVRYVAALALITIDTPRALDDLQQLTYYPEDSVKRVARAALCALPYTG